MKTNILSLSLAGLATIPGLAPAQGTYLSAPDGNPTNAVVVANGGSVGIGTSTPEAAMLQVAGDIRLGLISENPSAPEAPGYGKALWFSGGPDVSSRWSSENSDPMWIARYNVGDDESELRINIGDTVGADALVVGNEDNALGWRPRMTVRMNGNVGIGTATPNAGLHISYGGVDQLWLQNTVAGGRRVTLSVGDSGYGQDLFMVRDREIGGTDGIIRFAVGLDGSAVSFFNSGNVGIGTTTPQAKLDVNGKINCTVLELTSDRNQKQDFAAVDARRVLARLVDLPILTWAYTNDAKVRHLGPMAQDWKAAYPELGSDDKHIAAGDLASVALAAIQGLHAELQEAKSQLNANDARMTSLEKELATQKHEFAARFSALEKAMAQAAPAIAVVASGPSANSQLSTSSDETR